jgi:hypothetical protein
MLTSAALLLGAAAATAPPREEVSQARSRCARWRSAFALPDGPLAVQCAVARDRRFSGAPRRQDPAGRARRARAGEGPRLDAGQCGSIASWLRHRRSMTPCAVSGSMPSNWRAWARWTWWWRIRRARVDLAGGTETPGGATVPRGLLPRRGVAERSARGSGAWSPPDAAALRDRATASWPGSRAARRSARATFWLPVDGMALSLSAITALGAEQAPDAGTPPNSGRQRASCRCRASERRAPWRRGGASACASW